MSGAESPLATTGGALTYTDNAVTNGETYYYTVAAANSVGTGPPSNEVSATPAAPPPPTVSPPGPPLLTSATGGPGSVALTWTAPGDDGGGQVTQYQILRGTTSGGETLVATVGDVLAYTDGSLTNGVTYYYAVAAVNSAGPGDPSNELSAVAQAPPSAPLNLAAKAKPLQVKLTWSPPTDNGGGPIVTNEVWRGTTSGGEVRIAILGNVLSFVDSNVARRTTYYYEVRAINSFALIGPFSSEVSVLVH